MSTYLAQLFRNKSFKNLMLDSGQGANIQNINQQILSNIDVPLPPKKLQENFIKKLDLIEQQKVKAQESLEKAEELFNSLLQKAFNGELV
jgi:type I restriction enzyme S subunit